MLELFHKDKGFPVEFVDRKPIFTLQYSKHAIENLKRYHYTHIPMRRVLNTEFCTLIELEMFERRLITKLVYRTRYNDRSDITYVLTPRYDFPALVRTVWINHSYDNHHSINLDKYVSVE